MICIAVVEDDVYARLAVARHVRAYLEKRGIDHSIREFSNGESFTSCGETFDLVFMDIGMEGMDGLTAAHELYARSPKCAVVFVTSHPDFVFDSFDVNVTGYLLKPIDGARFARCMDKALAILEHATEGEKDAHILVKSNSVAQKIKCADIVLCESVGHKIRITTTYGEVKCYGAMDALVSDLSKGSEMFFRCHRAFVVNLRHVSKKERDEISTGTGHRVPLARRKQGEFARALLAWLKANAL